MSVLYSAQLVFMTKGVTVSEFWDNTYQKPLWYIPKLNVSGVLTIRIWSFQLHACCAHDTVQRMLQI